MGLFLKRNIKNLLRNYQIQPSKGLGQNFLVDKRVIKKVIGAAELKPNALVLEIGPGLGALTVELAKKVHPVKSAKGGAPLPSRQFNRAGRVIAVEKDPRMVEILKELLARWNVRNVEIINKDILKLDTSSKIQDTRYKVVGNLPFYLTAPVIRKFLEAENPPREMILLVQKEVGQRICASPAKVFAEQKFRRARPSKMNLLAVSVQFYAKPEIISYISKKSFWPQPKVDGAIIKISKIKNQKSKMFRDLFFKIVKAGFSQPRKQIINNLSRLRQGFGGQAKKSNKEEIKKWLLKNNIQPTQRAETLSVEDWIKLTENFVSSINFPY